MTASAFTPTRSPRADRFRPGDIWRGPDGKLYGVRAVRGLPEHVRLVPTGLGRPSVLEARCRVQQWRRSSWGGEP